MKTLSENRFNFYLKNFNAEVDTLPEGFVVSIVSNVLVFIVQAWDAELWILESKLHNKTKSDKIEDEHSINAIIYATRAKWRTIWSTQPVNISD